MEESSDVDHEKCAINRQSTDIVVPSPADCERISLVSDLWIIVSVITFIADVGSDLLVCVHYNDQNLVWYFRITLGLVVASSLALQIFSAKWFIDDRKNSCKLFFLHVAQLGPLVRYWSALRLCWISRQGRLENPYGRLIPKWRDLCMLRLLQAFLQSAPQAVFQLYVLCRKGTFEVADDLVIAIAAVTSLITVVWSLVCYSKALRDLRDNAKDLPWVGFTCQVLWRAFMVSSRVIALVLFASHFQHWMLLAVLGHWMLMAMWLACQRTQFCIDESGREHPCKERIFNCIIAFIYVFCFFNTKEGMTRKRIVLFYSVMLVENSLLISMWYPNRNLNSIWTYAALSVVWGGFILGVVFMILYYKFYHHSHAFKGLFIRTKTFSLHGRKMYGLYFCCCCRLKKWDVTIYDCRDSSEDLSPRHDQAVPTNRPNANNEGNLHWDNDDIQMRPLNGSCIRGGGDVEQEVLIQHPSVPEDDLVPNIVVTAASPLVLSPHESLGKLSLEQPMREEDPVDEPDDPPLSPGQTSIDKAREILASKLSNDSNEDTNEDEDEIPKINYGTVSFGNRYSLVSSDCISISSESSLSSFTNSLNDLLDRMGVASKNETEQQVNLKISPADEGIYSDERESPSKSHDTESEPSPPHNAHSGDNMVNGQIATPKDSPRKDESLNVLESMMDAPSSPYFTKRKRSRDRDEGSESESTDASSDDRERRHSCEDLDFSFTHSTPNEDKTKRHSLDIADLSSNYKRVKKKGRNKRRFNKIIIFDNFVSSALKPGKFGSLRKSYERLSKIQEDTEESGLLSNDSLKENRDPQYNNDLSLRNEEEVKNIELCSHDDSSLTEHNNFTMNKIINDNETEKGIIDDKQIIESLSPVQDNIIGKVDKSNSLDSASQELVEGETSAFLKNTNNTSLNGELNYSSGTDGERSSDDLSDRGLLIVDLVPSRFSTVRRSNENVPLACCEDFDDDLGSSIEDHINMENENLPRIVSPPSDKNILLQRNWSVDSIADSESSRESPNETINRSIASSGSSIFENILFLDSEQNVLSEAQTKKRHTFDFGAHRKAKARPGIVKRLGSSSSQFSLPRNPGGPIWVRKPIHTHRRRRPKTTEQKNKNNDNAKEFIQEVRV